MRLIFHAYHIMYIVYKKGKSLMGVHFFTITLFIIAMFILPINDGLANGDEHCLAMALYWEAKTEDDTGMLAVASVIHNRIAHDEFPNSVCAVIKHGGEKPPCQFSFWCDGKSDTPQKDSQSWQRAQAIAKESLLNPAEDITDGALFFHAHGLETPWILKREKTLELGGHTFYR